MNLQPLKLLNIILPFLVGIDILHQAITVAANIKLTDNSSQN